MAVASPPRPRTQDELDALVREARARQRRRRLIGAAAVAVVGATALISYAFASSPASHSGVVTPLVGPASTASCDPGQLAISLVRTGAVMGEEGGLLRFTNVSRSRCQLSGWPAVVAVEPDGKQIVSLSSAGGTMLFGWNGLRDDAPPNVGLRSGASAYAILSSGDNPVGANPPPSCPTARRLIVTAPHATSKTRLSAWLPNDATYLPVCGPKTIVSPVLALHSILH
jgi:Protein of unknown function (DUF4232)